MFINVILAENSVLSFSFPQDYSVIQLTSLSINSLFPVDLTKYNVHFYQLSIRDNTVHLQTGDFHHATSHLISMFCHGKQIS
jgi:hypothetical protein